MLHTPNLPISELEALSRKIRGQVVQLSHQAKTPHLGSSLSCVDILVSIFWNALRSDPQNPNDPDRDRFILSKGHAAMALYSVLAERGYITHETLNTYNQNGAMLGEHPSLGLVPGVEASTGSLGHGLSVGVGMALAGRIQQQNYRVFAVLSDGECNEGSVWEAAMMAAGYGLDRICVVVDYNKWQATDRSNEVLALAPLRQKWEAFGWQAHEIDGHELNTLVELIANVPDGSGKPIAIIANTVKGKGVSFMEDDNNWHYRTPTAEEVQQARQELSRI
jgi:transketolase